MKLKEAFTLQNKMQAVYQDVISLMNGDTFACAKVTHFYSKANIGDDVTEDVPVPVSRLAGNKRYEFDKLVDLAQAIIEDKQRLTIAIDNAKASQPVNFDALKQGNVVKQSLVHALTRLDGFKAFELDGKSQLYGKDNEGKPAVFTYPTKTVTTYDVNKDHLKPVLKRLKNDFDAASLKLDELMLTVNVDFVPQFDYDSNVEEIYLEL